MSFIALLLALLIERTLWDGQSYRQFQWFGGYLEKCTQPVVQPWIEGRAWAAAVIIALPLVIIAWIQLSLAPALGWAAEFLVALGGLLFALGPRELGQDVEHYLSAQKQTAAQAEIAAEALAIQANEPLDQRVSKGIFLALKQRLIGPLFWFVLLGAVGALAYRLSLLLAQRTAHDPRFTHMIDSSQFLAALLDWLPARVSAAGFAIAGNFDAVVMAWRSCEQDSPGGECPDNDSLVIATGQAALDSGTNTRHELPVEDALTLAWRNLSAWVLLLGIAHLFTVL